MKFMTIFLWIRTESLSEQPHPGNGELRLSVPKKYTCFLVTQGLRSLDPGITFGYLPLY